MQIQSAIDLHTSVSFLLHLLLHRAVTPVLTSHGLPQDRGMALTG